MIKTASGAVISFSLPGMISCKQRNSSSLVRESANGSPSGVSPSIFPMVPADISRNEWFGDSMSTGHTHFRDSSAKEMPPTTVTRTSLLVIGGGMSGLGSGYLLRDLKPMFLELNNNFGGNSRGESWNGIQYSIGAAYLVPPDTNHPLFENFYAPLGVDKAWRTSSGGKIIAGGVVADDFWKGDTSTDKAEKSQIIKLESYLNSVANGEFPEIPPVEINGQLTAQVKQLDRVDLLTHLQSVLGSNELKPQVRSFIEHYCWSSFGGPPSDLSAAAGLNFLAGEMAGIAALPGGNSWVSNKLMTELIKSNVPVGNFVTNAVARKVIIDGNKVAVTYIKNGQQHLIEADKVIIATPKFICNYGWQNIFC